MNNLINAGNNFYIIRTQAGLNKLLKRLKKEADVDEVVITEPIKYPMFAFIGIEYKGYHYIKVSHLPINLVKNLVREQ